MSACRLVAGKSSFEGNGSGGLFGAFCAPAMDQMPAMTTSAVAVTAAKDRTLFMEPSLRLAMHLSLAQRPCASSWQDRHYDALIVQPECQSATKREQMNAR